MMGVGHVIIYNTITAPRYDRGGACYYLQYHNRSAVWWGGAFGI
jgi:hypothetical protein